MALALCWVFCTDIRPDSDFSFIHHWQIGFYNRGGKRLLRGTDWFLIQSRLRFVFKRLIKSIRRVMFVLNNFFVFFFCIFCLDICLSTLCRCWVYCCPWSYSTTHTHTYVGLLWLSERTNAEASTWQNTSFTRYRNQCPRRDSNPQSRQASGRRPTPLTARPPGSVVLNISWWILMITRIVGSH